MSLMSLASDIPIDRSIVSSSKGNMKHELGTRQLTEVGMSTMSGRHHEKQVQLCGNDTQTPTRISHPELGRQPSPDGIHHGYVDAAEFEPIAIVGMGCRLPGGVSSPSQLWDLLHEGASGYCEIPHARFNIDSFYHPDPNRPGTANTRGGYFLSEDITSFENQFFGINNREATSMDPQQRKLLEVVFECFESAGVSMESLAGANIGCYVGNYISDFSFIQTKDPDLYTRYSATGMGTTILANRLNHAFDLRGPSLVIDTACSSSLYCLHVACAALASRECDGAVVAGVNLVQAPEHHLAVVKAGVLSASSTCRTFDASADGYGRADGVGALYIKRLSDAMRDGDPIRSVVRATAVNSNGHTNGITLPSVDGQEAVIRKAYAKAGLSSKDTHYVECHGTGTAVGDPIEVEALSRVFGESHSEAPLLIGSVKTNLGHSEAASGITSIIKTTLAMEKGLIPATIGLKNLNPNIQAREWNVKVVTEQTPWPHRDLSRVTHAPRASINSFGYGGANAHAIIEAAAGHVLQADSSIPSLETTRMANYPFIMPVSASNGISLRDRVAGLSVLDRSSISLKDLSHTLGSRRSHLSVRGYLIVDDRDWKNGLELNDLHTSDTDAHRNHLSCVFVFTGQGAQWPGMGRQLIDKYPSFAETIRNLDNYLARSPIPPKFSIYDTILEPAETSKINVAASSQPVCTAVQIALVDLLFEFNIVPTAVVGHSSGEIAASYAAGHISANEAILNAYYRGYAICQANCQGAMIAVGLGHPAAEHFIAELDLRNGAYVACVNSPESVTLSGDAHSIDIVIEAAHSQGLFTRKLRTDGKAYHSPHMITAGKQYEDLISDILAKGPPCQPKQTRAQTVRMISSVTGRNTGPEVTRTAAYWRSNLESPVLFQTALQQLASASASEAFDFVEIGPHPALELPVKQTLAQTSPIFYSSTLTRGKYGSATMLGLIGNLFLRGHAIAFDKVNNLFSVKSQSCLSPRVVRDLPNYKWQYDSRLWTESDISEDNRHRKYPPHDLLGSRMSTGNSIAATWSNSLSTKNALWLQDHKLGSSIVFPGAAYLTMAVEATCQLAGPSIAHSTIVCRHVDILRALILPSSGAVKLFIELKPTLLSNVTVSTNSWDFSVFSVSKKDTTMHAKGLIRIEIPADPVKLLRPRANDVLQPQAVQDFYNRFAEIGLPFGPRFQSLNKMYTPRAGDQRITMTTVDLRDSGSTVPWQESPYRIHPVTLDAVFQTGLLADAAGFVSDLRPCVPVSIDQVRIASSLKCSDTGTIYAKAQRVGFDAITFDAQLCGDHDRNSIEVHGVRMKTHPGLEGLQSREERYPYLRIIWKPDIWTFWSNNGRNDNNDRFARILNQNIASCGIEASSPGLDALGSVLDLIAHKKPTARVLELAQAPGIASDTFLEILRATTPLKRFQTYTFGSIDDQGRLLGYKVEGGLGKGAKSVEFRTLDAVAEFDIFVMSTTTSANTHLESHMQILSSHAAPGAVMLSLSDNGGAPLPKADCFGMRLSCPLDTTTSVNLTLIKEPTEIQYELTGRQIFLIHDGGTRSIHTSLCTKLIDTFKASMTVLSFDQVSKATVPVGALAITTVELETPLLKTAVETDLARVKLLFERASTIIWVTGGGLLQGKRPDFALYAGLSRAVALEQPSLNLLAFDVDDFVSDPEIVADNIVSVLDQSLHDPAPDHEYIHHHGSLYISRFLPDENLNRDFNTKENAETVTTTWKQAGHCQLAIDRVGQLDTLHFEEAPKPTDQLDPESVEDLYALNGRVDTKKSTCTLEYCGIVTRVGCSVTELALGDRVVTAAPGHFRSYERAPGWACHKLRDEEDLAAPCTLMVVFMTALYGLQDRANLQQGESVLIHSATGGAGLAAIQIAKLIGAEIYATVGTADKKRFLIDSVGLKAENIFSSRDSSILSDILAATGGRGVDVVFNSLTGELLHESWRACADFGRFVEIGKKDILESGKLDMEVFKRCVTFTAFDLSELFYSTNPTYNRLYHRLGSRVLELYRAGSITAIQPLKVFDVSELTLAMRFFSSGTRIGKVAVSIDNPSSQIIFRPPKYAAILSPKKSYLMVGCLGGLGRSLSRWMFDRGARNFVFLSRSGADKPSAQKLVDDLQESGANVVVVRGNVSSLEDVQNAVTQSSRPIGGVLQAAMGLNEALFMAMSGEFWHTGIDAKVLGTWNLHTAISEKSDQLDFFIMTSSISGSIGTATEGNYCAANHFLDNFARYRRNLGLPATSIGLGMISGVGYLHEHPEIEDLLLRKGVRPLNEDEVLRVFDAVLTQNQSPSGTRNHHADAHLLTGLEATGLQAQRDQGFEGYRQFIEDPRGSLLFQAFNESSPHPNHGPSIREGLLGKIEEAIRTGSDLPITVRDVIVGKMSNLILIPSDRINPETALASFGMDSMLAAELRAFIYQASSVDVPFQTLMSDSTTISSLADLVAREIAGDQARR